ncbi:NADH-quinone oxidoreductase subunit NuoH [Candidatus Bandiella numerosa]|jgi:NADH-quinone oxidoreductase subunit H|uniref:NADH-quinone oxidoreductase subunit NuoH n=1 Tax=Candidatus Bandiella numerosa TaxID=2570586 RepID=UPI00249F8CF9|nr:NADH-quinone oxidoreductase subunit NuoH [Candidatus Bandiella numerosa]WHA04308.1 NADH-quinone oxidoreductase subunit NuoH [Candidatus Bandiella numerosa]
MFANIVEILGIVLPIALKILLLVVPLLLSVAYLTLAERKIIGWMQLRKGPNRTGFLGLLQPIADALKLIFKEPIIPRGADKFLFLLAPIITFSLAMIGWAAIPIDNFVIANLNVGVMYVLAISSLGVYGIIIAGWASNSKYAFLGAIRSAAQMVSYEVAIGLCIICVLLTTGTLNLTEIVNAQKEMPFYMDLLLFPMFVVFFISILAETNRHPFDLPEAESELVAGYNVEYSSMPFALFFLGEYANMILMSSFTVLLFMGGWLPPFKLEFLNFIPGFIWFILKIMFCLFIFIWVRASVPRFRYDQLMRLGWKVFLPFTLIWVILIASIVVYT